MGRRGACRSACGAGDKKRGIANIQGFVAASQVRNKVNPETSRE